MIIDGREVANNLQSKIADKVKKLPTPPGLAVILVGEDPASKVYVGRKQKACNEVGFYSEEIKLAADTSQDEVLKIIKKLNKQDNINGILIQLPLPEHINAHQVTEAIDSWKDVDGFNSINIGNLMQNKPCLHPCTPKGVMTLLKSINMDIKGKDAVIVGASNIVGRPMAIELLNAGATVTVCHSKTKDLKREIAKADILVVAVGVPELIKGKSIKEGAVVIDVGINRLDNNKLVGDVEFKTASEKAAYITPVPGGVGPMTIATLLENTLIAYNLKNRFKR